MHLKKIFIFIVLFSISNYSHAADKTSNKTLNKTNNPDQTNNPTQQPKKKRFTSGPVEPYIHVDFEISKKDKNYPYHSVKLDQKKLKDFEEQQFASTSDNLKIHEVIKQADKFSFGDKIKNNFPNRLFLNGPRGTGKTTIAEIIARNITNCVFIRVDGPGIVDTYQGSGPINIDKVFELADLLIDLVKVKIVIFFDEVDSIAKKSETINSNDKQYSLALQKFWLHLDRIIDNPNYFVICATNSKEEDIHPTFLNRFGSNVVKVPNPNGLSRKAIIEFYLKKIKKECDNNFQIADPLILEIVKKTKGFGLRTIKNIVYDIFREGIAKKDSIIKDYRDKLIKEEEKDKKEKNEKDRQHRYEKYTKAGLALSVMGFATQVTPHVISFIQSRL